MTAGRSPDASEEGVGGVTRRDTRNVPRATDTVYISIACWLEGQGQLYLSNLIKPHTYNLYIPPCANHNQKQCYENEVTSADTRVTVTSLPGETRFPEKASLPEPPSSFAVSLGAWTPSASPAPQASSPSHASSPPMAPPPLASSLSHLSSPCPAPSGFQPLPSSLL